MLELTGYEILKDLYQGKHTRVYAARRQADQKNVILKALPRDHCDAAHDRRFRREFALTQRLGEQLEGVVIAHDFLDVDAGLFMVLEEFGGIPLAHLMRTGQWQRSQFFKTAERLVEIVSQIHGEGVVHKDVNPSNILINPYTDEMRVIDFGIAVEMDDQGALAPDVGVEGTPAYISPEQTGRMHVDLDFRTDLYSLGVTCFEMVTGRIPFEAVDPMDLIHQHNTQEPPSARVLDPSVPEGVSDLILVLLRKNPDQRPESAASLLADLEALPHVMPDITSEQHHRVDARLGSLSFATAQTTHGRRHSFWGDMLDYTAVLKSSQAISSEIVLEQLVERLMLVLLENAGAQRGVLLLHKDEAWRLVAECEKESVALLEDIALEDHAARMHLPSSVVREVCDGEGEVILEEPERYGEYADDPYLTEFRPVSILCTPILSNGKALGVIYLENRLVRGMFLQERLEVVRLLAAQAAIALENATLMHRLQESKEHLAQVNATLEQKVAQRTEQLRAANQALEQRIEAAENAQDVLLELARYGPKSYRKRLRQLLEACARTFGIERVSFWNLAEDHSYAIREDLYIRSTDAHFEEHRKLTNSDFPDFMRELSNMEFLKVDDVSRSERTRLIAETYFGPKGIASLLVVAVWRGGRVVGGLSLGHVGNPRQWSHIEVDFAVAVGQLISLAIEGESRRKVESHLRLESEIAKRSPLPFLRFNVHGRLTFLNPAAEKLFGEGNLAQVVASILPPVEKLDLTACVRGDQVHRFETDLGRRHFAFEIHGSNDMGMGQIFGFDITELNQMQRALKHSEAEYRALLESSNDAVFLIRDDKISRCNSTALRMFNLRSREDLGVLVASDLWPAYQEDGRPSEEGWAQHVAQAVRGGAVRFNWLCQRGEAGVFATEVLLSASPGDGTPILQATVRDISLRKQVEQELRLTEERWQYAVEGSQDGIFDWDIVNDEVYYSPRWKQILGYAEHELAGAWSTFEDLIHEGDREQVSEEIRRTLTREANVFEATFRMVGRDAGSRWILARAKAGFNEHGEPIRLSGSITDMTERNLADERFRVLFEYSSDAQLLYDDSGIVDCNQAALEALGFADKSEMIGVHPHQISPENQTDGLRSVEIAVVLERQARALGHHHFEWEFLRPDGRQFPAEVTLTQMTIRDQTYMLAVIHDISDRRRNDKLHQSQTNIMEMISSEAELDRVLEVLAQDVVAQIPGAKCCLAVRSPRDEEPVVIAAPGMRTMENGKRRRPLSWEDLFGDGTQVIEDFEEIGSPGPLALMAKEEGMRALWMKPIYNRDNLVLGAVLVFTPNVGSPRKDQKEILDTASKLAGIAVQRRRIEWGLRDARDAAEMANRAKTRFLSNMSHELRTPLNAVLGFGQLMARDTSLSERSREYLETVIGGGVQLHGLINDILEMSRIESGNLSLNPEAFDLRQVLVDLDTIFQGKAERKNLTLSLNLDQASPRFIRADLGKLRQILINLISNGVKFTDTGSVTVNLSVTPDAGGNQILACDVIDTGIGIDLEDHRLLFEPFSQPDREREARGGAGLGLAICREFIEFMGGAIDFESRPGQGSRFFFQLTVERAEEKDTTPIESDQDIVGIVEDREVRILIVEDNAFNRELLKTILEPVGFALKEAENGDQALTLVRDWRPDLVLMDMAMPVMDGIEATARIKQGEVGEPIPFVIALTASAFAEDRDLFQAAGCDAYIDKPFRESELFSKMARLLKIRYLTQPKEDVDPKANKGDAKQAFAKLSDELIEEIEKAALLGDLGLLRELIDRVQTIDTNLAEVMLEHLDHFAYDALIRLVQGAGHEQ